MQCSDSVCHRLVPISTAVILATRFLTLAHWKLDLRDRMDAASVARSLQSGTTYLKDPVVHLLGHPAAQVINEHCVAKTLENGCRLLTHYTTGAGSKSKPFRWMVMRRISWSEVLEADPERRTDDQNHPEAVWHTVITELTRRQRDTPIICASFFGSNLDLFFSVIRDKFEFLDEDDPEIIRVALQDEDLQTVLRLYFETGSPDNPKFMHTLATVKLLDGQCLLHHCCERNFVQCVCLLLEEYTPQTAPPNKAWLQLADVFWQDRTWHNSAFSIAAYRGHATLLEVLWAWAKQHHLLEVALTLRDKKGMNLCEIIEDRLAKLRGKGAAADYVRTFNVIAADFGKLRKNVPSAGDAVESLLIIEKAGVRDTKTLQSRTTLSDLAKLLVDEQLEGASVLFLHLQLSCGEPDEVERFLGGLLKCRSIRFMKCTAPPSLATNLVKMATSILRSGTAEWTSLGILPQWQCEDSEMLGTSNNFAEAVHDLVETLHTICGQNVLAAFDMPAGTMQ